MRSRLAMELAVLTVFSMYLTPALGAAAEPSDIGYLQLAFYSSAGAGSGSGFVKYDPASLNPFYEYRDALTACEESGDFDPCKNLPDELSIPLLITEAQLRIAGAVFTTENFSWSLLVDGDCFFQACGRDSAFIDINNGIDDIFSICDARVHDEIIRDSGLFGSCSDFFFLNYEVNGIFGDDSNGNFTWSEAPIPSPEPGTLALLGLGLAGLGVTRRRFTA